MTAAGTAAPAAAGVSPINASSSLSRSSAVAGFFFSFFSRLPLWPKVLSVLLSVLSRGAGLPLPLPLPDLVRVGPGPELPLLLALFFLRLWRYLRQFPLKNALEMA
jgi:hypothetical protein